MSLYRPAKSRIWWMDFFFSGQRIRESTKMTSRTRAREVEDRRKQELREGTAGIRKRARPKLFSSAAAEFCDAKNQTWSKSMRVSAQGSLAHLLPAFGKKLVVDIEAADISRYQRARTEAGAAGRTANIELSLLRSILRKAGAWPRIQSNVTMLNERTDAGHALTAPEEAMLLAECAKSRSRILLPFVTILLETGARLNTVRTLRWGAVDFAAGAITIGKDKTKYSAGRTVPLSQRAIEQLKFWAQMFPDRKPDHFVFPKEKYATAGKKGKFGFQAPVVFDSDPTRPIGSIKESWEHARERTRYHCPQCADGRLRQQDTDYVCAACGWMTEKLPQGLSAIRIHDLRHSAASRMIAAGVPLPIVAKILGWSAGTTVHMAQRYGHFSIAEMRNAVESISPNFPGVPIKVPIVGPEEKEKLQ